MEIITVFGVRWRVAPLWEVIVTIIVLLIIVAFFILLRYYQYLKLKKSSLEQIFLYKARQKGLTGYQIRVLQHIVHLTKLRVPEMIFTNKSLFETGIVKFLQYLSSSKTINHDVKDIFKDIVITYQRLYYPAEYQEPIQSPDEIPLDTLVCGYSTTGRSFIAKIITISETTIECMYYRKPHQFPEEIITEPVTVFFFRSGDAEYSFESEIVGIHNSTLLIKKPQRLHRGKEVHHPYINTFIPCTIIEEKGLDIHHEAIIEEEEPPINGTIERLNEYEAVVRAEKPLKYHTHYTLFFTIDDFNIEILSTIIAAKSITKEKIVYHTFRFIEMSEAARNVISKYVKERL